MTDSRDRRRLNVVEERPFPAYVVWELTLRCDHACHHCGSRAGKAREDELSTEEALDVVRSQTVGVDEFIARWVARLRRRPYTGPPGPADPVGPAGPAGGQRALEGV